MRNVACVKDVRFAVRLYYSRIELQSRDIKKLFGISNSGVVVRKKNEAKVLMEKKGIPTCGCSTVHTKTAYEAWGLDIADLERRLVKIEKYGAI